MPPPALECLGCKNQQQLEILQLQYLEAIYENGGGGGGGGGAVNLTGINGVAPSVGCGTEDAGTLRVAQATDCTVPIEGSVVVSSGTIANPAVATGGYTPGKLISAATTNATTIKAGAGTLGFLTASNVNASPRYLKLYNKASNPTVGTDTPVFVFLIPGNTAGAGTNLAIASAKGINFSAGIAFAMTTGVADTDTGAVAANEVVVNYGFI